MTFDKVAFLAAAQKKKDAATALLSDSDREEAAAREEGARILSEARAAESAARELDLARREEAARARLGDKVAIRALAIKEFPDTFIVERNGKAHAKWQKLAGEAATNKKIDSAEIALDYAVAVVHDWSGITDFGGESVNGYELRKYLKANPGMVTPITNAAAELNGVFVEERKSGG